MPGLDITPLKKPKKENSKNLIQEKEILAVNKEVYENMIIYIRGSDLTERSIELVRSDILDMLLDAQFRGDNIGKIFGEKYKKVCDEIIDAMPKKTPKNKFIESFNIFFMTTSIIGFIILISKLSDDLLTTKKLTNFTLTLGELVSGILVIFVSFGIVRYISKTALKGNKSRKQKYLEIIGTILLLGIIVFSSVILPTIIFETSYFKAFLTVVILFVVNQLIEYYVI